ncbi:type I cytoskeletal 10-like protein [Raphanus sativus]|nr:type I cytoskeletal 10-like protein [Raphanus sativus]
MMRNAFSRLIRRSAANQRHRHSAGDDNNRHGKKGPFSTRDKPMPPEPEKIPPVLSKRDKRVRDLRLELARIGDRLEHRTKGGVYFVKISNRLLRKPTRIIKKKLMKVQWELLSLGELTGGEEWIGGGVDVSGGGLGTGCGGGGHGIGGGAGGDVSRDEDVGSGGEVGDGVDGTGGGDVGGGVDGTRGGDGKVGGGGN